MTRVRRWTAPLTNEHRRALLVVVVVDNSANYLRAAANFARATGRRRHNRSAGSHTRALASGPKPEEARTGCIGGHPNGSPRVRPSARLSVCLCDGSGGRRSRSHERPRLPANCCTADRRSNDRSCCLLLLYVRVGSHVRTAAANFIRLPLRTGAPVWSGPLWSPPIQSEPIQPEADSAVGTRKGNTAARERDARVRSRALAQREREREKGEKVSNFRRATSASSSLSSSSREPSVVIPLSLRRRRQMARMDLGCRSCSIWCSSCVLPRPCSCECV